MPDDQFPHRILVLLVELLQSGELPELALGGALTCLESLFTIRGSAALGQMALEANICEIAMSHLRAVGCAADWMVRPRSSPQARRTRHHWFYFSARVHVEIT